MAGPMSLLMLQSSIGHTTKAILVVGVLSPVAVIFTGNTSPNWMRIAPGGDWLPALADKQWGGDLQQSEYKQLFEVLQPAAPGQNLDRKVPSVLEAILEYEFQKAGREVVEDRSGNYHGKNHGCETGRGLIIFDGRCHIDTPFRSYGKDYTLSLEVRPTSSKPSILLQGQDTTLWLGHDQHTNVTMISGGYPYTLNYTLPVNAWSQIELQGRGNRAFFWVRPLCGSSNAVIEHEFITRVDTNSVQAAGGIAHV
ncbi:unnamed protein product [Clonostachys rhizophaga]|uniref:Uncharacterized protein n=1 Tax=Clonostachys rhizophaga TaxID=160324 RepID=A0A9N9YQ86_9HYPO|nr:unnamed protein product [Clonostachys rhizophaga]